MKNRLFRFIPLLVAIAMILGIMIGTFYSNHFAGNRLAIINTSSNKLTDLLHLVDDQYVDSVNIPDIVEKSLPKILKELDPHSTYISAKDVESALQDLKGSFQGIGVQFSIQNDTVCILKIIESGPAQKVGLRAGDRIVTINDSLFVGKSVTNDETMKRLKGKEGTEVKLGIKRKGISKLLDFTIQRGSVPVKTVDASYMLNDTTGYVRITSFGDNTYPEFLSALATLNMGECTSLVIDLRNNLGGYMHPAILVANEFLSPNRLIVYMEGRHSPREDYRSDGRGMYKDIDLVVLVDEGSASASEIFAGAIQDNDRGVIVGRRTFGKGLVQTPIEFRDGSMLRLTKARYYTPAGRCVQKPYVMGNDTAYEADLIERALHGEYYSADSIKVSGDKYTTIGGRTVYGGGGIIPDYFIPRDTVGITSYFRDLYNTEVPYKFVFNVVDEHRELFESCPNVEKLVALLRKMKLVDKLVAEAEKKGVKRRNLMIRTSYHLIERYLFINIIDQVFGVTEATKYENRTDAAMLKALEIIDEGKARPIIE
ncbi:MAG: S41 family peptidase [Prevotellamassilia sp.]|jgi:carboxyl-terminal processing protease|nr:S41 family peptidase [Prevotellamassilia sp.]